MLKLLKHNHTTKKIFQVLWTRRRLLLSDFQFYMTDLGSGSRFDKSEKKHLRVIVRKSCSPLLKSVIIGTIARRRKARAILELGTCIGLNAVVMGILNPQARVITVEGDGTLHRITRRIARMLNQKNIVFVNALFDDVLEEILYTYQPDFIFVDGNHSQDATLQYFRQICESVNRRAMVVVDDIDWSQGMREAWKKISCPRIRNKIGFVKFGIVALK